MQKLNSILDKFNQTQNPIFPNIEHSQHNDSADSKNSDDNHEESLHSAEDQVIKISNYNDDDLKNKDELASQETVEETKKYEADIDQDKDLDEVDLDMDENYVDQDDDQDKDGDMNDNERGFMITKEINTVVNEEGVKSTDFDDEREGEVVDVDNGEEDADAKSSSGRNEPTDNKEGEKIKIDDDRIATRSHYNKIIKESCQFVAGRFCNVEVEHKTITGFLSLIEKERMGGAVDRILLNHLWRMFTALGIYSKSSEKLFLEGIAQFYAPKDVRYTQLCDGPDYLKHVEAILHEEHESCVLYLGACTRKALAATAEKQAFQLNHIPSLVVLHKDGKIINPYGVELFEEFGVEGYPFTAERIDEARAKVNAFRDAQNLESLLVSDERDFVIAHGEIKVPVKELLGKTVLLYFSVNAPGDCYKFTAHLKWDFYKELWERGEAIEVVFLSDDQKKIHFQKHYEMMPWLAFPFGDKTSRYLEKIFHRSDRSLMVIGPDGKTVRDEAQNALISYLCQSLVSCTKHHIGLSTPRPCPNMWRLPSIVGHIPIRRVFSLSTTSVLNNAVYQTVETDLHSMVFVNGGTHRGA